MTITQKEYGWGVLDRMSGKFIGIDHQSGGYPYIPDRSEGVRIFASDIEAQRYADMFSNSETWKGKMIVKRIERFINVLED